jgi:gliding motility-associated-like protein
MLSSGSVKDIFVPNAFSPNDDGDNDVLYVRGDCVKKIEMEIFDRWGKKICTINTMADGWDGTFKGKPMDPAVFVYFLRATLTTNEKIKRKGNISLMR